MRAFEVATNALLHKPPRPILPHPCLINVLIRKSHQRRLFSPPETASPNTTKTRSSQGRKEKERTEEERPPPPPALPKVPFKPSFPKNSRIKHPIVQVLNEDGTLSHPHKLSKVLESIDLTTKIAMLVNEHPPTVKIVSKLDEKMRKLEAKAEKKSLAQRKKLVTKEVQLTWSTAGADLDHKFQQARAELEKGDVGVDIAFLPKTKVRNPPRREMEERMDEVVAGLADVATEWKARTFGRGEGRLYFRSTVKKAVHIPTKEEIEEQAREELQKVNRLKAHLDKKLPQN